MKRLLFTLASIIFMAMPLAGVRAATLTPGTLIKASGAAVYYYTDQGTRLVFPNAKTYFTWFPNFSNVVTITDSELAAIQIGGNVTYRPGVKMVKVTTDPKVYAVDDNGTLRWVTTEGIASALYGANWAKQVDDVPDAFFSDYSTGAAISNASSFDPAAATNRNTSPNGSTTTPTTPATIQTSESQTVNLGDTFAIALHANPTTGYAWTQNASTSSVALQSDTYSSTSTLMGASGTETFTFKTLVTGSFDIVFTYARPWETTSTPAELHTVHVTVNPAPAVASQISLEVQSDIQPNENVPITAHVANSQSGDSVIISLNGVQLEACGAVSVCSVTYLVPTNASVAATSTVTAVLRHKDASTETASATLSLVAEEELDSIILQIPRAIMDITTPFVATAYPGSDANATDLYIVIDGVAVKDCRPNPSSCIYQSMLTGDVGSVHTVYARVKTFAGLFYRSKTLTVTLATNDAPTVSVAAGKTNMYSTETVDVTAKASSGSGISSIVLYQNGNPIKTCTGVSTCTATVGPFPNLHAGDTVSFSAMATDAQGASTATSDISTLTQDAVVTITK